MSVAAAVFWPVIHLALVVFLIVGGPASIRRPVLARAHLAAVTGTSAVFLAGYDCPFTVWEKSARVASGWPSYEGGFIEHYLVRPVHPAGITPWVSVLIMAVWVVPTVVGHGVRWRQVRQARPMDLGDAVAEPVRAHRRAGGQPSGMSSKVAAASTPRRGPASVALARRKAVGSSVRPGERASR